VIEEEALLDLITPETAESDLKEQPGKNIAYNS